LFYFTSEGIEFIISFVKSKNSVVTNEPKIKASISTIIILGTKANVVSCMFVRVCRKDIMRPEIRLAAKKGMEIINVTSKALFTMSDKVINSIYKKF
jgi:hypothetical protein